MLTRSDITILMQQVDVTKAYDLLAMFKEAGKERIDIRTILDGAADDVGVFLDEAHLELFGGEFAVFFIFIVSLFCFATNL